MSEPENDTDTDTGPRWTPAQEGFVFLGRHGDFDLGYRVCDGELRTVVTFQSRDRSAEHKEAERLLHALSVKLLAEYAAKQSEPATEAKQSKYNMTPRFTVPENATFLGRFGKRDLWYRIHDNVPMVDFYSKEILVIFWMAFNADEDHPGRAEAWRRARERGLAITMADMQDAEPQPKAAQPNEPKWPWYGWWDNKHTIRNLRMFPDSKSWVVCFDSRGNPGPAGKFLSLSDGKWTVRNEIEWSDRKRYYTPADPAEARAVIAAARNQQT
jgi:hypothetical protein